MSAVSRLPAWVRARACQGIQAGEQRAAAGLGGWLPLAPSRFTSLPACSLDLSSNVLRRPRPSSQRPSTGAHAREHISPYRAQSVDCVRSPLVSET